MRLICSWLAAACLVWGADGIKVWAIGDTVRIDPIRNQAFEENPSLFPDGVGGDYKSRNLVWDGASRRITVHSARNETVAFQIIIERTAAKLSNVKVELGKLSGPDGSSIPAGNVDLYREWYVEVESPSERNVSLGPGWYPDGLLPCLRWTGNLYPHTYVMPFDLPDPLNWVGDDQKSQAMWVDVYVPNTRSAAPPGSYTAPITVSSDQGNVQLTLDLHVWDFALPEESHLTPNIHADTEINTFPEELELKYYQLIRKHRLSMYPLGYAPALTVSGTDVEIDWTKYDARLGKYLDGSAFTEEYGYNGPGYGVPIEFLMMPFDAYPMNLYKLPRGIQKSGKEFKYYAAWPVSLPKEGRTPEYRQIWLNTFRAVQEHFDEQPGWDKTRLLVFFLSLDEAYDEIASERMFYYGQLLKDAGTPRLEYRVDGSYPKETTRRLSKILDIALLGMRSWQKAGVEEIKKQGVDTWFYTGSVVTDGDGLNARSLSWLAWKWGADSWALWELDFNSLRAWQDAKTYGDYNGLGMLVYRGETMGLDEPAASMRLKGLRRGSQDYEYFWLLSQTDGGKQAVDEAVNAILHGRFGERDELGMPEMWNHDPDAWDRVRLKLGEAIEKTATGRQ